MRTDLHTIIALRHQLHQYPELSMQEYHTKETLMSFLTEQTTGRIYDRGSWFCCVFGEEKSAEAVAFRAEMDALPIDETIDLPYASVHPGISHKCGHDGQAACLCALAMELEENPANRPVWLIFQPGEEIGAGGKACAAFLKEAGIHEVYAFHNLEGYPENSIIVREGLTQPASEGLRLYFTGRASHASEPEHGVNPSVAIAETILFTQEWMKREHRGLTLITIVGVKAGSGDFGISAGEGELSMTLRAEYEDELAQLEGEIKAFAATKAKEYGLGLESRIFDYFPETRNDPAALERVRKAAARLGRPLIERDSMWRASEDFGYYTKAASGALFYIGTGEDHPALHTSAYDFNDNIIETAVDMLRALADQS